MITFVVENLILMILFPHAKINIGLNILSKRPDGYHEISSVFYPVKDCCDILEINESSIFSLETSGISIPNGENLCEKAYRLLKKDYNFPNINIFLKKQIPIGAGLGGGSADAAFTLIGINRLFNLKISQEDLCRYALKLGADCPFFIQENPKYVKGVGEKLKSINLDLSSYNIRLIYSNIHISTKEAYSSISPTLPKKNLLELISSPIENWKENIQNDFEKVIFSKYPKLSEIKDNLYSDGAIYASMSGSGSVLFGIFEK